MLKRLSAYVLVLSSLFFAAGFVYAQQNPDDSIAATAAIKSIETKGFGKKKNIIAAISYKTVQGKDITTVVELVKIPFFGTFSSAGDTIDISYNKANPAIAHTKTGGFIDQYGLYILIALGLAFSIPIVLRNIKRRS
jgi:hypothetical protein